VLFAAPGHFVACQILKFFYLNWDRKIGFLKARDLSKCDRNSDATFNELASDEVTRRSDWPKRTDFLALLFPVTILLYERVEVMFLPLSM